MPHDLTEILTAFKHGTDNIAKAICSKQGYKTPYVIHFKNLDDLDKPTDFIIPAGNPVNIYISQTFALWCLFHEKKMIYRYKLASALENMHRVHRTLKHPISLEKAIALRKESREWVKTLAPDLPKDISLQHLKIIHSVTVIDTISELELTLHGDDPVELKKEAIRRLSNQVYEHEDYEEMHEKLKDIIRVKNEKVKPSRITIDGNPESVNVKVEY